MWANARDGAAKRMEVAQVHNLLLATAGHAAEVFMPAYGGPRPISQKIGCLQLRKLCGAAEVTRAQRQGEG
jgi:hypothetical protein